MRYILAAWLLLLALPAMAAGSFTITIQPGVDQVYTRTTDTGTAPYNLGSAPILHQIRATQVISVLEYRIMSVQAASPLLVDWTTIDTNVAIGTKNYYIPVPASLGAKIVLFRANRDDATISMTNDFYVGRPVWSVAKFVDSIGVNGHWQKQSDFSTTDTPSTTGCMVFCTPALTGQMMTYLGIRRVRVSESVDQIGMYQDLCSLGLLMTVMHNYAVDALQVERSVSPSSCIGSIQGPNEINNGVWHTTVYPVGNGVGQYPTNTAAIKQFAVDLQTQRNIYFPQIPLVSYSNTIALNLTVVEQSANVDFGNVHNYPPPGGFSPIQADQAQNSFIAHQTSAMAPNKPFIITENGFTNDVDGYNNSAVDDTTHAIFNLEYLFDAYWHWGAEQAYIYELYDPGDYTVNTQCLTPANGGTGGIDQCYYGLFKFSTSTTVMPTPKLAATAIHNLTTIIADTGTPITNAMNMAVSASPLIYNATTHEQLSDLVASDGSHWLFLWTETDGRYGGIWTTSAPQDGSTAYTERAAPNTTRVLTFQASHVCDVFDVLTGTSIQQTSTGTTCTFSQDWGPKIIHVH